MLAEDLRQKLLNQKLAAAGVVFLGQTLPSGVWGSEGWGHVLKDNPGGVLHTRGLINGPAQKRKRVMEAVLIHHHPLDLVVQDMAPSEGDLAAPLYARACWNYPLEGGILHWTGNRFDLVNTLDLKWLPGWDAPGLESYRFYFNGASHAEMARWASLSEAAISKGASFSGLFNLARRLSPHPPETAWREDPGKWLPTKLAEEMLGVFEDVGVSRLMIPLEHHLEEVTRGFPPDTKGCYRREGSITEPSQKWLAFSSPDDWVLRASHAAWTKTFQGTRPRANFSASRSRRGPPAHAEVVLIDLLRAKDPHINTDLRLNRPEEATAFLQGWEKAVEDCWRRLVKEEEERDNARGGRLA